MRRSSIATVIAAALAAVTIAGCSTTLAGNPTAASKAPATEQQQTTAASDSAEPTESGTTSAQPPVDPTSQQSETSQAQPGGALDADSVNWLTTFCTGFQDVMAYAGPDTTGMSDEATIQTVSDAYGAMASAADSLASDLQNVPPPTFSGAPVVTSAVDTWLRAITAVYGSGAQQIANGTYSSAEDLSNTINQIESGLTEPTQTLTSALGQADPAVKTTMQQIPACTALMG